MMGRWPLTIRGTGAVLFAVACMVLAHQFVVVELLYVGALMFAVVAVSAMAMYFVPRSEQVTRSFLPEVATVGEEVTVRARVEIRSPLPVAQGRWRDDLSAALQGDATGRFPATVSGMATGGARLIDLEYRATALRRGVNGIGPLSVTSADPFGFIRRRTAVGEPTPLTIAPQALTLIALTDLPGEAGGSLTSSSNQLGQGSDNLIPRHYVPGDSMRRIHWRASAHRDELMVRQEEQETTPAAVVVLDRGAQRWDAGARRVPGEDPGFEAAVTACVSIAAQLVSEGYHVSIIDVDGSEIVEPIDGGDRAGIRDMLTSFATVTARAATEAEALVRLFSGVQTGPLVLITGPLETADVEVLAPLPHHSALPVLVSVASQVASDQAETLGRAAATGWRAISAPAGSDFAAAWAAASERGMSRVGA
jgi:uncharacterized protein (DUF58 family)